MSGEGRLAIAVVGGGVAGITAAHILSKRHDVTLFERNDYVGGHTNTIVIADGPDAGTPVDTGFIVCNDRTYPLFHKLLKRLDVPVRSADMSFGYHCRETGLQYGGKSLDSLFAQRSNLLRPSFWKLLREIARFGRETAREFKAGRLKELTLGDTLFAGGYDAGFIRNYILPMGASIWSTAVDEMLEFPAETFARFFHNHGLLDLRDRPQWQTVVGGSRSYVTAFLKRFPGEVHVSSPVEGVERAAKGVFIHLGGGRRRRFDRVVVATHADEALTLLKDPSPLEKELLGPWRYSRNRTVLHTDSSVLAPSRRAWSSWNYVREAGTNGDKITMTYDMNNLQGLSARRQYCVTLNREKPVAAGTTVREMLYAHPRFTSPAVKTQGRLGELNGKRNTFFCGSYFGFGFHEDAVRSSVRLASFFRMEL